MIGDVPLWSVEWQREPGADAAVIDPIYGQTHHFAIYHAASGSARICFAAGEFSNGVWGFYIPA